MWRLTRVREHRGLTIVGENGEVVKAGFATQDDAILWVMTEHPDVHLALGDEEDADVIGPWDTDDDTDEEE